MSNVLEASDMVNNLFEAIRDQPISIEQSQTLLSMAYTSTEQERINDLLAKNRQGLISTSEKEELDRLVDLGMMLAALQSKARMTLKKAGVTRS